MKSTAFEETLEKECFDDVGFVFNTEFAGEKDCVWLSEKDNRKMKYCETRGWGNNVSPKKVKYACKKACANFLDEEKFRNCKEFQDVMLDDDDEMMYSGRGKQCWDSFDFEFETEFVGTRDCSWLSEKTSRQMKYCEGKGWDGGATKKVKFGCKESCRRYLSPRYLELLGDCHTSNDDSDDDECTEAAISVLDNTIADVDRFGDSEVIASACSAGYRSEIVKDIDNMKNSSNPCVRRLYENTPKATLDSYSSQEDCEEEIRKELVEVHNSESSRRLMDSDHRQLGWFLAPVAIFVAGKLAALAVHTTFSVKGGKRRQLRERDDLVDLFDFVKGEPVVTTDALGMDIDNPKYICRQAEYEGAVIITPGPHFLFGAKPADSTNNCPVLAFDSHYSQETKTMFVIREEGKTSNLRSEGVDKEQSAEGWDIFNDGEDPIYPLGSAKLHDIYNAFNATEPLQLTEFHVEKHNCFHFVKNMWRHLDIKEDEGLLDFVVENVVKDDNISRMLSGVGSSGGSRKAINDKEALHKYIHSIVAKELDL